ncbi:MAG: hypothetical protein PHS54_01605 [Clostridia bacterium]|nr:hypothetical protein [Clostridia bacterium]
MALILRLQNKLPFDRCSLDNILKVYNIEIANKERHSALADCEHTAKAFLLMFNELSGNKVLTGKVNGQYDKDFNDEKKLEKDGGCQREN